jgi:hypothetical protein
MSGHFLNFFNPSLLRVRRVGLARHDWSTRWVDGSCRVNPLKLWVVLGLDLSGWHVKRVDMNLTRQPVLSVLIFFFFLVGIFYNPLITSYEQKSLINHEF